MAVMGVCVLQTEGEQAYVNVRKAFVAPAGYCVVSADFCQLELRLMAHFSGDNALICMLNDPEWDPFVKLASRWKVGSPLLHERRVRKRTREFLRTGKNIQGF
jgi:DNA polymerase theta